MSDLVEARRRIIDVHHHIVNEAGYVDGLLRAMNACVIERLGRDRGAKGDFLHGNARRVFFEDAS